MTTTPPGDPASCSRLAAPVPLAVLLLGILLAVSTAACTPRSGPRQPVPQAAAAGADPAATPSTNVSPVAIPPPPRLGSCHRLGMRRLSAAADPRAPVPCHSRHDSETIYVGTLRTVFAGHSVAIDSHRVRRQLAQTCSHQLARFLGGTTADLRLSRFASVRFGPTIAQARAGARWFRCDAVAFASDHALFPLPAHLHGALARAGALSTYGLCGTAAPGSARFSRVICARRHSWRAIAALPIPGGSRFPGVRAVRRSEDAACRDRVHLRSGFALRYQYGWEWPTREQWLDGQHYGYCWAPTAG